MKIKNIGSGSFIRGFRNGEDSFVATILRDRVTGISSTSVVDIKDARITQNASAPVAHEFDLLPAIPLNASQFFAVRNLTPSVASFDPQTLQATRVADGTAQIAFSCAKGTRIVSQAVSEAQATSVQSAGWVPGTLAASATNAVDTLIAGKTAGSATQKVWNASGQPGASYPWNTSLWASGIDFTCLSPWNDWLGGSSWKGGTLVSPRHLICANHISLTNGQTIWFVKSDGTPITRTIAGGMQIDGTDIYLAVLSSDVPTGISFAKVLPANWKSYLPSILLNQSLYRIPVAFTNQFKTLRVYDWYFNAFNGDGYEPPIDSQRSSFFSPIIVGDSGSPAFLLVNGVAVLLSCWLSFGLGPMVSDHVASINSGMTLLGGGYQLTFPNLAGFPTF